MTAAEQNSQLTGALEDYLETIYGLRRDQRVARVRDIAKARNVRAASVTPAMRRLSELGLVRYIQREYIDLTPEGEEIARRVLARHRLLARFFEDVLGMKDGAARDAACAMEHSLSAEGLDCMARFFEFVSMCQEGARLLERFHGCGMVHEDGRCEAFCSSRARKNELRKGRGVALSELQKGARARITQISDAGLLRQKLLDMGLLPDTELEVLYADAGGMRLSLQGFELHISSDESQAVQVRREG